MKTIIPAHPEWYLVIPYIKENPDGTTKYVRRLEPIIAWYIVQDDSAEICGPSFVPKPITACGVQIVPFYKKDTIHGIEQSRFKGICNPDGEVTVGDNAYPNLTEYNIAIRSALGL